MTPGYKLQDGEAMHRESPRTFSIPRSEVRRDLPQGALVKLVFGLPCPADDGCGAERMWCQVTARQGRGYIGRLVNRPLYVEGLAYGDPVAFQPRHVVAIDTASKKRLAPLVGIGVDVLRGNRWPAWLTRVEPTGKYDSGWRVFSDREARGAATVRALSCETAFRSWAILDSVIDPTEKGVWRWDKKHLEYRRYLEAPAALATSAATPLGRLHRPAPPADQQVVITRKALGKKPSFAQRLSSRDDTDSGWCIFVGDEPQSYLDDAKNSTVVPVARLLFLYPSCERVLGEPGEKLWRWDDDAADWVDAEPTPARGSAAARAGARGKAKRKASRRRARRDREPPRRDRRRGSTSAARWSPRR